MEGWTLDEALLAWEARPAHQKDPSRDRQFLTQVAIQLVQVFREEEDWLRRNQAPGLTRQRIENQRLALRLRGLMTEAEHGADITCGLQDLLGVWRERQNGPRYLVPVQAH